MIDFLGQLMDTLNDIPAPIFALLGVLLGALVNTSGNRWLHRDKLKRERNDKIRQTVAAYVAAVHSRWDARQELESSKKALAKARGPKDFVQAFKGGPPSEYVVLWEEKVREAKTELVKAEREVDNLFFQLSILKGKGESDLIFALKALGAAKRDDDMYVNAYNFLLGVMGHWFSDDKAEKKAARKNSALYRPLLLKDWKKHCEELASPD